MDWAAGLDWESIARRLRALQQAVSALSGEPVSHAQMAEWAGVGLTAWGNYYTGLRPIPPHAVAALKLRWGVAMDWVYLGDATKNDPKLAKELDKAMRNPIPIKRGRKPLEPPKGR
jgi:hypothetical protein